MPAGTIAAEGREELRVAPAVRHAAPGDRAHRQRCRPGRNDASIVVDFQDGRPLQTMTRPFTIAPPEPF